MQGQAVLAATRHKGLSRYHPSILHKPIVASLIRHDFSGRSNPKTLVISVTMLARTLETFKVQEIITFPSESNPKKSLVISVAVPCKHGKNLGNNKIREIIKLDEQLFFLAFSCSTRGSIMFSDNANTPAHEAVAQLRC